MHTVYKALAPEDVESIIAYCQDHTIKNGGLFEVYPDGLVTTIVVNSTDEPMEQLRPLGAFYTTTHFHLMEVVTRYLRACMPPTTHFQAE